MIEPGPMASRRRLLWDANVLLTGLWLGILQWSVFFLLQSFLASTAIVYLLSATVWLMGSLAGLAMRSPRGEWPWFWAALASYYLLRFFAMSRPYEFSMLSVLLPLVAVIGAYAGRFFRFRSRDAPVTKHLFLIENTGFLLGLVALAVLLFAYGDAVLLRAPFVLALAVALSAAQLADGRDTPPSG